MRLLFIFEYTLFNRFIICIYFKLDSTALFIYNLHVGWVERTNRIPVQDVNNKIQ